MPGSRKRKIFKAKRTKKAKKGRYTQQVRRRSYYKSPLTRRVVPNRRFVRLPWFKERRLELYAVDGNIQTHIYRANSLFDPDTGSEAHKPRGFTELMQMYNNYTVIACKIHIRFWSDIVTSSDTANGHVLAIVPSSSATAPTAAIDFMENDRVRSAVTARGGSIHNSITHFVKVAPFLGYKDKMDDALQGTSTTSPSDQLYWHLGAWDGS